MLAKVVKQTSAYDLPSFQIPEIGQGNFRGDGVQSFELPSLDDFSSPEKRIELSASSEISTDKILSNARDEAAQILRKAEEDSQLIEQAAREKGLQEIEQKIAEGIEQGLSEIRQNFADSINEVSSLQKDISERVEKDLVEISLEIAKKIVGREVKVDREIALTLVRVSIQKLDDRTDAKIHLHPEDFEYVSAHRENLDFRGTLELIEDNSVSLGGCLVHTETGDIDARIESQFEEIAHGLLSY